MLPWLGLSLGQVSVQTDDLSGVDGNTYTSPTFEYTVSWNDQRWEATDAFSENGYDALTLASAGDLWKSLRRVL